jgi:hypothetical protein
VAVCKTAYAGSNPVGASKLEVKIADTSFTGKIPQSSYSLAILLPRSEDFSYFVYGTRGYRFESYPPDQLPGGSSIGRALKFLRSPDSLGKITK